MYDAEFLPAEPPHWAARGLAWLMVALFSTAIAASALVRVPESIDGRFVLVPVGGTDPVRAPRGGVVTAVHAAEGRTVARGAALFHIRSEAIGDRWAELQTLKLRLAGAEESERNAQRQFDARRESDAQEARRLTERIAYLGRAVELKRAELAIARELAERKAQGHARGVVSGDEHLAAQAAAQRLEGEIEQARDELTESRAAAEKLRSAGAARDAEFSELRRSLAAQRAEASVRVGPLEGELARTAGMDLVVVAPCAGAVVRLHVRGADAVVREGDVLGELACAGSALRADLALPAAGAPLVQRGQPVKLFYDAFPYQRYGVRWGTVRWLGPASGGGLASDSGAFRALVDVDGRPVVVRGRPRPLMAGMAGRARVVVDRRTLIGYAFEPIRELRENLATR